MSFEARHLLRVLSTQKETAHAFQRYCIKNSIVTRNMCRIGKATRSTQLTVSASGSTSTAPTQAPVALRALVARTDIATGENVVVMPVEATLSPATALRCAPFLSLFPPDVQERHFFTEAFARNSRIAERSVVRCNQLLLALYMTYLILAKTLANERLVALPGGGDAIAYLDFLPRSEGRFDRLEVHIAGALDASEVCRTGQSALAGQFGLTQAEVRPVVSFCLCMIFSRMVPVDFKHTLHYAFQDTPLSKYFAESVAPPEAAPPLNAPGSNAAAVVTREQNPQLVPEPIAFLCPVIDLCNHSLSENVAVMAPFVPDKRAVICLQTLRDIKAGEELTMNYSSVPNELRTIWGMDPILL